MIQFLVKIAFLLASPFVFYANRSRMVATSREAKVGSMVRRGVRQDHFGSGLGPPCQMIIVRLAR